MKDNKTLLGYAREGFIRFPIRANSKSIRFGFYRLTKSELRKKLRSGKGRFTCWACLYVWEIKDKGISETSYGYRIPPVTYKKIVKWSKSK